jgi:hypothetical protein
VWYLFSHRIAAVVAHHAIFLSLDFSLLRGGSFTLEANTLLPIFHPLLLLCHTAGRTRYATLLSDIQNGCRWRFFCWSHHRLWQLLSRRYRPCARSSILSLFLIMLPFPRIRTFSSAHPFLAAVALASWVIDVSSLHGQRTCPHAAR